MPAALRQVCTAGLENRPAPPPPPGAEPPLGAELPAAELLAEVPVEEPEPPQAASVPAPIRAITNIAGALKRVRRACLDIKGEPF